MTIIRRRYTKNFTVLTNEVFADERLDLDALGLLCYLRSRPNDWKISQEHLRRRFGCGPEKMQRLMRTLLETGWLLRQEGSRGQGGRFGGLEYVVLDEPDPALAQAAAGERADAGPESEKPLAAPESEKPESAEPESVDPESVEPESVNPTAYKELDSTKGFSPLYPPVAGGTRSDDERVSERDALAGGPREPDRARRPRPRRGCRGGGSAEAAISPDSAVRFDRLWAAYPISGRLPTDRAAAIALFAALALAEQETAIRAAALEARVGAGAKGQARRLDGWLRDGKWRNAEASPLAGTAPGHAAAPASAAPADRVFVREGTPAWEAWERHERAHGRVPKRAMRSELARADGWWFPSERPPAAEQAA